MSQIEKIQEKSQEKTYEEKLKQKLTDDEIQSLNKDYIYNKDYEIYIKNINKDTTKPKEKIINQLYKTYYKIKEKLRANEILGNLMINTEDMTADTIEKDLKLLKYINYFYSCSGDIMMNLLCMRPFLMSKETFDYKFLHIIIKFVIKCLF